MPGPGQQARDFSKGRNVLYAPLGLVVFPWHITWTLLKNAFEGVLSVSDGLLRLALYEDVNEPLMEEHKGDDVAGGCLC